jgi:hypothetical protein
LHGLRDAQSIPLTPSPVGFLHHTDAAFPSKVHIISSVRIPSSTAPTRRVIESSLGTMPTALVRRLISSWPPAVFVYIKTILADGPA